MPKGPTSVPTLGLELLSSMHGGAVFPPALLTGAAAAPDLTSTSELEVGCAISGSNVLTC